MLVASAGTVSMPAARRILGARFTRLRVWLCVLTLSPKLAEIMHLWEQLGLEFLQEPLNMLSVFSSFLLLASCFPGANDLAPNTPASYALVYPTAGGLMIVLTIAAFNSWVYRVEPDVNDACRWVHLLLILGQMTNKYTLGIAIFMHHAGWGLLRRVLACDGLLVLLSTLAYRVLGPPEVYPPGNVTFNMAIVRGLMFLMLSLVLTPSEHPRTRSRAGQPSRAQSRRAEAARGPRHQPR